MYVMYMSYNIELFKNLRWNWLQNCMFLVYAGISQFTSLQKSCLAINMRNSLLQESQPTDTSFKNVIVWGHSWKLLQTKKKQFKMLTVTLSYYIGEHSWHRESCLKRLTYVYPKGSPSC